MSDPILRLIPWALVCTLLFFVVAFVVPLKRRRTQELFHGRGHLRAMADLFAGVMVALTLLRLLFYDAWLVKVFIVPIVLVGWLVGVLTLLAIRAKWERSDTADRKLQVVAAVLAGILMVWLGILAGVWLF